MRNNSRDSTIERNYIQRWRFLMREFELVKAGRHPPVPVPRGFLPLSRLQPADLRQVLPPVPAR